MDCHPNPPFPDVPPHDPCSQASWADARADRRTEAQLHLLQGLIDAGAALAHAVQRQAMHRLEPDPLAEPSVADCLGPDENPPTGPDACLSFTRLFRIVCSAITLETRITEARRTRDMRDRLAERRATSAAEYARRRTCHDRVRTTVSRAIDATEPPKDARTVLQQRLNQRLADPDIDALLADHPASAIAAALCEDLGIALNVTAEPGPPEPSEPEPDHSEPPPPAPPPETTPDWDPGIDPALSDPPDEIDRLLRQLIAQVPIDPKPA